MSWLVRAGENEHAPLDTAPYLSRVPARTETNVVIKITGKHEITIPAEVLDALGVGPGDRLELHEKPDGFLLRPQRNDFAGLAPLHDKIRPGSGPFDLAEFRNQPYAPALRD
jgi:AbrB family looped-hinge helix DNA binding protein